MYVWRTCQWPPTAADRFPRGHGQVERGDGDVGVPFVLIQSHPTLAEGATIDAQQVQAVPQTDKQLVGDGRARSRGIFTHTYIHILIRTYIYTYIEAGYLLSRYIHTHIRYINID